MQTWLMVSYLLSAPSHNAEKLLWYDYLSVAVSHCEKTQWAHARGGGGGNHNPTRALIHNQK